MDIELCVKSGQRARSIGHRQFSPSTSVKNKLKNSCTVEQRGPRISIAKQEEELLSIAAIFEQINVDGHRDLHDMAKLLYSEPMERQVVSPRSL